MALALRNPECERQIIDRVDYNEVEKLQCSATTHKFIMDDYVTKCN